MCIEPFKKELAWAADKWFQVISTIMLFKKQLCIVLTRWKQVSNCAIDQLIHSSLKPFMLELLYFLNTYVH